MKMLVIALPITAILLGGDANVNIYSGLKRDETSFRFSGTYQTTENHRRESLDTLTYSNVWMGQFTMRPGDAMMTVFQMPADGYVTGVNIPVYDWGTGDQELTVSLHKLSYPFRADSTMYPGDVVDIDGWVGGYNINDSGWVTIMGNEYTPGGTVGICNPVHSVADFAIDPLANLGILPPDSTHIQGWLWPDSSSPATLTPTTHPAFVDGGGDNWFAISDYGNEPYITVGTWVGILVRFTGTGGGDDDATGFFYTEGDGLVDPWASLKFYHGCSGTSGNGGWHIRHWVFGFELATSFTGDRGPQILDWNPLTTTLSTADREITATIIDGNPSGGIAGVDSALIYYSIDNQITWSEILMTANGDSTFTGFIPGQSPTTNIDWYLRAVDVNGNDTRIPNQHYFIFAPIHDFLVLANYNTPESVIYQPPDLPLIPNTPVGYDIWYCLDNGPATLELLSNYVAVIELTGDGPLYLHDQVINYFIEAGGHYIIAGNEWLQYEWQTCIIPEYLALDNCYNDINILEPDDITGVSRIIPVANNPISGSLTSFLGDSLDLSYDPYYELGNYNRLDAIEPMPGVSVAFYGVSGVLDSAGIPTGNDTLPVGIYYETDNGSRVVAFSFDPMALNTTPSYYWVGLEPEGPLQSAMAWISEILTTKRETPYLPSAFVLHQNVPNPFNPVTTIRYDVPEQTRVKLTVLDLLGREVATLVDEEQAPGKKEVRFTARDLSSGVYFYRLTTPDFTTTRKLVVLK